MNIYVGNLSRDTSEDQLREAFEKFGAVDKVNIITDRYSGESRGFGFVEMPSKDEGQAAIAGLHETEMNGRNLNVNEARPRPQRGGGGGRDRRGGGGGGRRF
jgi:RNA recognition motif-containing protein